MDDCTISRLSLSPGQLRAILDGLTNNTNTSLRFLNLTGYWKAFNVAPDILAGAAVQLESLKVSDISDTQVEAIFTRLAAAPDSRLKHLKVGCLDVWHMDPEVVKAALTKLESVGRLRT